MIGTCEALAMGEAHGLDPAVLSNIMKASSGNNWSLQVYNPWPDVMEGVPSSNQYRPGFMVDLMVKDLGLACEVAESCDLDNQMGKQAMATFSSHQGQGNGDRDFSSILEWVKAQH
jgi:3-hydroxyisobutyrate dehydrogenase